MSRQPSLKPPHPVLGHIKNAPTTKVVRCPKAVKRVKRTPERCATQAGSIKTPALPRDSWHLLYVQCSTLVSADPVSLLIKQLPLSQRHVSSDTQLSQRRFFCDRLHSLILMLQEEWTPLE